MIYITGDTHSDFSRFTEENFPIQSEMTKDDYIIICGDFGGVWTFEEESKREKEALDWLNNKNFTTLFVDGNHENYTRLYNYPIEEWKGGKVHEIRDSVLHLMRGEIFDIDNKKIFAFGGARSHDIQDGILNLDEEEKIYDYRKRGAYFRIRDFSWWDLELPTKEEMKKIYEDSKYELKKFFNTSGVKYRELGLKEVLKTATEEEMLELLASDGKLIKRPLLVTENKVLIGFKENEYKENLL